MKCLFPIQIDLNVLYDTLRFFFHLLNSNLSNNVAKNSEQKSYLTNGVNETFQSIIIC